MFVLWMLRKLAIMTVIAYVGIIDLSLSLSPQVRVMIIAPAAHNLSCRDPVDIIGQGARRGVSSGTGSTGLLQACTYLCFLHNPPMESWWKVTSIEL